MNPVEEDTLQTKLQARNTALLLRSMGLISIGNRYEESGKITVYKEVLTVNPLATALEEADKRHINTAELPIALLIPEYNQSIPIEGSVNPVTGGIGPGRNLKTAPSVRIIGYAYPKEDESRPTPQLYNSFPNDVSDTELPEAELNDLSEKSKISAEDWQELNTILRLTTGLSLPNSVAALSHLANQQSIEGIENPEPIEDFVAKRLNIPPETIVLITTIFGANWRTEPPNATTPAIPMPEIAGLLPAEVPLPENPIRLILQNMSEALAQDNPALVLSNTELREKYPGLTKNKLRALAKEFKKTCTPEDLDLLKQRIKILRERGGKEGAESTRRIALKDPTRFSEAGKKGSSALHEKAKENPDLKEELRKASSKGGNTTAQIANNPDNPEAADIIAGREKGGEMTAINAKNNPEPFIKRGIEGHRARHDKSPIVFENVHFGSYAEALLMILFRSYGAIESIQTGSNFQVEGFDKIPDFMVDEDYIFFHEAHQELLRAGIYEQAKTEYRNPAARKRYIESMRKKLMAEYIDEVTSKMKSPDGTTPSLVFLTSYQEVYEYFVSKGINIPRKIVQRILNSNFRSDNFRALSKKIEDFRTNWPEKMREFIDDENGLSELLRAQVRKKNEKYRRTSAPKGN